MTDVNIDIESLKRFCTNLFVKIGLYPDDAQHAADVLVTADIRGIHSHGVGRILRWLDCINTGMLIPGAGMEIIQETPTSLLVDAHGGPGAPVSVKTMKKIIAKAESSGAAFAAVRNSNHFGIAGYYAMMALNHDMLGIALTNTPALAVPTFGRKVMFGTNPIAFAAPADEEKAFVLDMSTSVVPRGKIEVYDKKNEPIPLGWAVDKTGQPTTNAHQILDDMYHRLGGGVLPLGGAGERFGGHKGYGLAVMVDILCAALGGGPMGSELCDTDALKRMSHFFGAVKISTFRDPDTFRTDMDQMLRRLSTCPPAEGEERVWFAGQKEFLKEEEARTNGIQLPEKTQKVLRDLGEEYGLKAPF
jgi:LDH2 family malate/lactate/ureidoglycolate dehydrogenase